MKRSTVAFLCQQLDILNQFRTADYAVLTRDVLAAEQAVKDAAASAREAILLNAWREVAR